MKKLQEIEVFDVSDSLLKTLEELSEDKQREMLRRDIERFKARKAAALGVLEERNLEGDEEMVIDKLEPLAPDAKWLSKGGRTAMNLLRWLAAQLRKGDPFIGPPLPPGVRRFDDGRLYRQVSRWNRDFTLHTISFRALDGLPLARPPVDDFGLPQFLN
ncbi:MAG: hypothetical protein KKC79_09320 [Gammaproteobacteria bacterium]|nr:hypothetical protein [Gammaproteobacteria bacterium]MBU1442807.1 hypothetical protein [Gammaproteobacteria bacterium]MBU2289403.1 hypothetical protein [Gammaproteobacteria bacterium]MBU2408833.1 hypothetical protein [Gammaproteobacteria bacterium]